MRLHITRKVLSHRWPAQWAPLGDGFSILSLTLDSHCDYLRNYERVIFLGGDSLLALSHCLSRNHSIPSELAPTPTHSSPPSIGNLAQPILSRWRHPTLYPICWRQAKRVKFIISRDSKRYPGTDIITSASSKFAEGSWTALPIPFKMHTLTLCTILD
jgi:hypothetical protein